MSSDATIADFLASVGPDADPSATWAPPAGESTAPDPSLPSFDEGAPGQLGATADLALGEVLGEGGMGVVMSARQDALDRDVAVKRLKDGVSSDAVRALAREARVMGRLDHPNIIPVHALGKDESGRPVVVMKKVDGVPWRALVDQPDHPAWTRLQDRGPTPIERHLSVFLDVCRAVAYAHDQGILHLDLKPDNVMIGEHGQVYVVDWGLARRLDAPRRGIAGSPAYMAPELATPGAPLDARTDVFLLGATLYEVLTGSPPRQGKDITAVLEQARQAPPLTWPGTVATGLVTLVDRACAAEREDRPSDVPALMEALRTWIANLGSERLARAADRQAATLQELLREQADPVEVIAASSAARFGYEQALEAWPDNPAAQQGLSEVLERMVGWSVQREEHASATGLLAALEQHDRARPELRAAVDQLGETLQARRSQHHEQDLTVGYRSRMTWIGSFLVLGVILGVIIEGRFFVMTHLNALYIAVVVVGGTMLSSAAMWSGIGANRASRRMVAGINLVMLSMLVHRLLVVTGDNPPSVERMLAIDQLLIAFASLTLAVIVEPWLMLACLLFLIGGSASYLHPPAAYPSILLVTVLSPTAMVAILWWRQDHHLLAPGRSSDPTAPR